jgi:2-keto-4-pentenoate hydratase
MKSMSKLSREQISTASAALVNAVRHGITLTGWPNDNDPASIDDAYLIQHLTHETLGRKQAGWKVGWTTRKLQKANGVQEPMVGRIPAETVVHSGSTVRELRPGSLKCEAELAFRLARDLPARPRPYSEMELIGAIHVVYPAIEIVGSRFVSSDLAGRFGVVADNGAHAGLVLGAPIEAWREMDRVDLPARLYVDNTEIAAGTGANVLGDPLTPCLWLLHWLNSQGEGLSAGDVVSSGSFLGAPRVPLSSRIAADFGKYGQVTVTFVEGDALQRAEPN